MIDIRRIGISKNYWYPVAFEKAVRKNHPCPVRFAGDPVVLYRTESGGIHALQKLMRGKGEPLPEYASKEGEI